MHFSGLGWKVYRMEWADVIAAGNKVKAEFTTVSSDLATATNASGSSSPSPASDAAESNPGYEYSDEYANKVGLQAHQIGLSMSAYANDHNQKYPDGSTSTEVFQKLVDGGYVTDPTIFYSSLPGKKSPTSKTLKAENVSFDVTAPVDASTPDDMPIVFSTGYVITYSAGANAAQDLGAGGISMVGVSVCTKGNETSFKRPDANGTIAAFIPFDCDPGKISYRQLTPDNAPLNPMPPPPSAYPVLDEKNGFRDYKLGTAFASFNSDDLEQLSNDADETRYSVKNFDSKVGSAEISGITLVFSEGLLKEIWVQVQGDSNKAGLLDALTAAYGKPQNEAGFEGETQVWAGIHVHLDVSSSAMGNAIATFKNTDVEAKIKAIMEQKAKAGAAQGAKEL